MNVMTIIGIVLIVVGVIGLIFGGIAYSSKTNEIDIGSFKVQAKEKSQFPLSPVVSGAVATVGVALVIVGRARKRKGNSI